MKCLLFFSDFLLSNEMSGYPENKSTIIFFVSILLLSYEPDKIRQNNMDHLVGSHKENVTQKPKATVYFTENLLWGMTWTCIEIGVTFWIPSLFYIEQDAWTVCVPPRFKQFFSVSLTQSVAELILYSQKTQNCGHFLSNLMNYYITM